MILQNDTQKKIFAKSHVIFMVIIICVLHVTDALGKNFYQSCIYSSAPDLEEAGEELTIYPVNQECATGCQDTCNTTFSRKIPIGVADKNIPAEQTQMMELNESAIYDCISTCQKGEAFSAWIMIGSTNTHASSSDDPDIQTYTSQLEYNQEYSTSSIVDACSAKPKNPDGTVPLSPTGEVLANNFVRSTEQYIATDSVTISLSDNNDNTDTSDTTNNTTNPDSSKVYMCGRKVVMLTPVFPNIIYLYPDVIVGGDAQVIANSSDPSLPNRLYFDYTKGGMTGTVQQKYLTDMTLQWTQSAPVWPASSCTAFKQPDKSSVCSSTLFSKMLNKPVSEPTCQINPTSCSKQQQSSKPCADWGALQPVANFPCSGNGYASDMYAACWPSLGKAGNARLCPVDEDKDIIAAVRLCANHWVYLDSTKLAAECKAGRQSFTTNKDTQAVTDTECQTGKNNFIAAAIKLCSPQHKPDDVAYKMPSQEWTLTDAQAKLTPPNNPKLTAPRYTHPCFVGLSDRQWNTLSNVDIFSCYKDNNCPAPMDNEGRPIDLSQIKRENCFWNYHIRSTEPTETGILYAPGDDITISFAGGAIIYRGSVSGNFYDYKSSLMSYFDENGSINDVNQFSSMMFRLGGAWHRIYGEDLRGKIAQSGDSDAGGALQICIHGAGDSGKFIEGSGTVSGITPVMSGNALQNIIETVGKDDQGQCASDPDPSGTTQCPIYCNNVIRPGQSIYKFSYTNSDGYTDADAAQKRDPIAVQHPSFDNALSVLGGTQVKIDWGGCPIIAGGNLQIAYSVNVPQEEEWKDINLAQSDTNDVTISIQKFFSVPESEINRGQYLYFRIKGFVPPNSGDPTISDLYAIHNRMGHYNIRVVDKNGVSDTGKGPLYKLVRTVDRVLFGDDHAQYTQDDPGYDPNNKGVVSALFTNVIKQGSFVKVINVMLLMFLIFSALAYLMGLIQMDAHEGVMRILQLGLIVALISPESWEFFGVHIVSMFVDGALNIANTIVGSQYVVQMYSKYHQSAFSTDKFAIFQIFTGPMSIIFSSHNMARLLTLLLSSVFGLVLFCCIIVSSFICIMSITKATVFFLFCLAVESTLIILAPLTLPMILFKHTRSITLRWFKQLISYALQPIFLFASISVLNSILIAAILGVFSFTICPKCLIAIPLPLFNNICLLHGYGSIVEMHYPNAIDTGFTFPLGPVVAAALFAVTSSIMYYMTKVTADVVPRLVGGEHALGGGVAAAATNNVHESIKNVGSNILSTAKNVGSLIALKHKSRTLDSQVRNMVKDYKDKYQDNNDTKKATTQPSDSGGKSSTDNNEQNAQKGDAERSDNKVLEGKGIVKESSEAGTGAQKEGSNNSSTSDASQGENNANKDSNVGTQNTDAAAKSHSDAANNIEEKGGQHDAQRAHDEGALNGRDRRSERRSKSDGDSAMGDASKPSDNA